MRVAITDNKVAAASSANLARVRPVIYLGLAAYALVVIAALRHHEPWVDEAQSWLLGRDESLAQLWNRLLHYEGTPGLWQTLLHVLIWLGLPYSAYNYVPAALSFIAACLLIRYAPLPAFIRVLLPFTYYLCYQYAVVARSYALIAPLLFAIAMLYPHAQRKLLLMTVFCCLLAGVSVHGFLISCLLWFLLYGPLLLRFSRLPGPERRKLPLAGLAYGCVLAFLLFCAWPAKDVAFAEHRGLANIVRLPAIFQAGLAGAFTGNWVTSLLLIALSAPFLWRGGGWLFFLLATVAVCLFGAIVYAQLWHFGILFLAWIFAIWISAYRTRFTAPTLFALIVAIAVQCYWTVSAIRYDWSHAYSGSRAAAEYLKKSFAPAGAPSGGLYAIGFPSTALQPYFPSNIYSDFHGGAKPAYWDWSKRNTADDPAALVASSRREFVLVGYKNSSEKQHGADLLALLGYDLSRHFDGHTFWQTRVFEDESYDLYQQTSSPRAISSVNMSDPTQSAQLLSGFYGSEGKTRWTAKNFSVLLKAPSGSDTSGAYLSLKIYVPDVQVRNLGPMTLRADLDGLRLAARTFSEPGQYTYSAHVPAEALRSGFVVVNFRLDKSSIGLNGDSRELGIVVTGVDLAPPSLAQ